MFDTTVTIVGNALNAPELRRTNGNNTLVASFRVASTSRRFDRDSGRWVDGPSLRVRVTCWRRLAEGVKNCVGTGDPLVVTGRMFTRDWIADDGQHRVSYELEAIAVGHDLSRGFSEFTRHRPAAATSAVEDAEADTRIAGEVSLPADPGPERADADEPSAPDDPAGEFDPARTERYFEADGAGVDGNPSDATIAAEEDAAKAAEDAMRVLNASGLGTEPVRDGSVRDTPTDRPGGRRGRSRTPVPA
jgi:single-strand DNA-binding protein